MSARTSPTIDAADLIAAIEEFLPDFTPPVLSAPRFSPIETAHVLLSLLGQTAIATARLADYRHRENGGATLGVMLSDDLLDVAAVRKPLHIGARAEPGASWLVSLNEARRLTPQTEMWFVPSSAILTAPFVEAELLQYPISEVTYPLVLSAGLLGKLAGLFSKESLYSAAP